MKQKVLATSWHPGGINAIIPVIKKLQQDQALEVIAIGHQYSESVLYNNKVKYRKVSDYGLFDVSLNSMGALLERESPDLILTGTSTQDEKNRQVIEQNITVAGRQRNIPTVAVLDFWANYSLRFNDIYSGENFRFLPDKIAIMDQYAERAMLAEGFDKSRLVITGNPYFDDLEGKVRNFTEQEKSDIRLRIGLNADVLLFYAANAWEKEASKLGYWDLDNINIVNEFIAGLPKEEREKYGMVVKLHPRVPQEDLERIKKAIEEDSEKRIVLVSEIHPQNLILSTDLTLTPFSTLGIEAVLMRKPCISMQPNLKGNDYLSFLTNNQVIPVGYTTKDCMSLVRRAFVDKDFREKELIDQSSNFKTDGKATERVINLIYQLL